MSLARQNYATELEAALNQQINMELKASQAYLSLYSYFIRDTVALPGLAAFFKKACDEERDHAHKMIDYQTKRGGHVILESIPAPEMEWQSAKTAVEFALALEKGVNKSLLNLHSHADQGHDPQFCDFIESEFLGEQVDAIKMLSDYLTQLQRVGNEGLGLYLFDQNLLKNN